MIFCDFSTSWKEHCFAGVTACQPGVCDILFNWAKSDGCSETKQRVFAVLLAALASLNSGCRRFSSVWLLFLAVCENLQRGRKIPVDSSRFFIGLELWKGVCEVENIVVMFLLASLGVHYVFDTTIAADFSILESQREFVQRYQRRNQEEHALPMFASACPGENWLIHPSCPSNQSHWNHQGAEERVAFSGSLTWNIFNLLLRDTKHTVFVPSIIGYPEYMSVLGIENQTGMEEFSGCFLSVQTSKFNREFPHWK